MLNRSKNGLKIFDSFSVDYNLPKHNKKNNNTVSSNGLSLGGFSGASNGGNFLTPSDVSESSTPIDSEKSFFNKCAFLIKSLFEKKPKLTVGDFFKSVKASAIDIVKYTDRVNSYVSALSHAMKNNQQALVQDIQQKIDEAKYESILYAGGFKTVITEEQVVKFYKECQKGLELTWIRNFIRVIPEKASDRKKEADTLEVFDNFCILHFDVDKKSFKEEDKDPILFGVIQGSRKLYYIADWIDEYCDLTLEQFIDKFGDDAITANDITVNFKLKK
jgi:hypothetical protein